MEKFNFYNHNIFILLFAFFPIFLVTGPALPDIYISLMAFYFIIYFILLKGIAKPLLNKLILFIFIFCLSLIFSSLNSENLLFSLSSSFPYLRFFIFISFIYYFSFKYPSLFKKYIFVIMSFFLIFVSIDTYFQFFIGTEIFGHKIDLPNQNRLTGPFPDDERIVGSYMQKFIFIVFGYLLLKAKNNYKGQLLALIIFGLIYVCIFITGERMAFILASFGTIFLIIFNFNILKKFIYILIFLLTIITMFTLSYDKVRTRMINATFEVIGINIEDSSFYISEKNFWDSHYGAHYLTAYEIFKDNVFFGSGPKTYRIVCSNDKYSNIDSFNAPLRCSTHPHNIYFQLLSETGILGLSSFLVLLIYLLFYSFKNLTLSNPLHNCTFITLFLFLWPLQSTGSLFNNWYAGYFFYLISLVIILVNSKDYFDQRPE